MSLTGTFNPQEQSSAHALALPRRNARAVPPFSIRLFESERARLIAEARGAPLGTYIKAKLLGAGVPQQVRRTGLAIEDRQAMAKALALLGQGRLTTSLNQLAQAANIGTLPVTPETEAELLAALGDVRAIRQLLLTALGMKQEAAP